MQRGRLRIQIDGAERSCARGFSILTVAAAKTTLFCVGRSTRGAPLVLRVPRRAWKRDCIADVREPGDVRHRALEAEAEPGVGNRAVPAQIAIPPVVLLV